MPRLDYHCRHTKKFFGKDYKEFHKWKDSAQQKFGPLHRCLPPHILSTWLYVLKHKDPKVFGVSLLHDIDDTMEMLSMLKVLRKCDYDRKVFLGEVQKRLDGYYD